MIIVSRLSPRAYSLSISCERRARVALIEATATRRFLSSSDHFAWNDLMLAQVAKKELAFELVTAND